MGGPELMRSRRLVIAGALAVACAVVLFWWARWPPPPLALLAVIATSTMARADWRRGRLHRRTLRIRETLPVRFAETSRGLAVAVTPSFAAAVTLQLAALIAALTGTPRPAHR